MLKLAECEAASLSASKRNGRRFDAINRRFDGIATCGGRNAVARKKSSARHGSAWRINERNTEQTRGAPGGEREPGLKAIEALAEKQEKRDDALVVLREAQAKTEERFQELGQDMNEGFREMREGFRETRERFRETDARTPLSPVTCTNGSPISALAWTSASES
jgi:hypothetical protein